MVGLVGASVIAFGGSLLLLKLTDLISPLRVKESEEVMGLDVSQHGEGYLSWVKDENGIHAMKETPGKMVPPL